MTPNELRTILEAKLQGDKKLFFESSLNRIMQHVQNAKTDGFAILTSWRQSNDKRTNQSNFQALQSFVREKGLGFIQLRGHWQECQDTEVPYSQCPQDQMVDSVEPSIMVFKIDLKTATALGKQFDQDAVVYGGPETGGSTQLHFKDGTTLNLGEFNPMAISQAFSEFRSKQDKKAKGLPRADRVFHFEGYSYPAQGFIEKLLEQTLQKNLTVIKEGLDSLPGKK